MFNSSELMTPLTTASEYVEIKAQDDVFPVEAEPFYDVKLVYLRKGTLTARLGEEAFSMAEGELLLVCPQMGFSLSRAADENPEILLVRMDPAMLMAPWAGSWNVVFRQVSRQRLPVRFDRKVARECLAETILEACLAENRQGDFGWEGMVFAGLNQLFVKLIRKWRDWGLKLPVQRTDEDPIAEITCYIQQHVEDGIRVEELAERCNLSYPWFAKRFREMYGISCKDYIERIRVSRVERYLRYSDLDLAEISEITGYADCSHMIKNFKKLKDMTPGKYRANAQR